MVQFAAYITFLTTKQSPEIKQDNDIVSFPSWWFFLLIFAIAFVIILLIGCLLKKYIKIRNRRKREMSEFMKNLFEVESSIGSIYDEEGEETSTGGNTLFLSANSNINFTNVQASPKIDDPERFPSIQSFEFRMNKVF